MKKLVLFIILLFAPLLAAPVVWADDAANPAVVPAHLSAQDKADLARIETYLNGLKNIVAGFLQVDDAGGLLHGNLKISRPGKMRVDYDPPNKDFIIADGSFVHIWNNDLQSQTNVEQGTSLAEFILRDPIKLSGEVTVTKFQHMPAKMEVTLVQTNDPGAGSLTLVFEDKPLQLRQWKVIDAQGRTTGVNLENMSQDVAFPAHTFFFVSPNFDKN
jgi:outer membrane lipoprotein-sorting protein